MSLSSPTAAPASSTDHSSANSYSANSHAQHGLQVGRGRRPGLHHLSLRRFIMGWIVAIVLAFALLCGGLVYAVSTLHAQATHIFLDSKSLQTNHAFETALLAEGREDLLWRLSGEQRHSRSKALWLRQANLLLQEMVSEADAPREVALMGVIQTQYQTFRQALDSTLGASVHGALRPGASASSAAQESLDKLQQMLHRDRDFNQEQMNATMRRGNRVNRVVDVLAVGLIALASLVMVAGGVELWSRIFRPTLLLARAARAFGGGDLQARAPVVRADEMGALASTFNTMAESIRDREKERLEFVATVAHDLRNPLAVIGGAAHLLQRKHDRLSEEEQLTWLSAIERNTHGLEAMIADLMDGVQAETGCLSLSLAPLDFALLCREITSEYIAATPTHLIRFSASTGEEPCLISGDLKRLTRVVMNLISNAIKYSEAGTEIWVDVTVEEAPPSRRASGARAGQALMRVRDEGVGIAPEDVPRLFRPFSRLDRTRTMAKGTGLGLSSVKKIVEGHGGTITIHSTLDVGTTMEVRLPLLSVSSSS